ACARSRGTAVAELLPVAVGAPGAAAGVLGAGAVPAAEHGLGRGDRPRRLAGLPAARRLDGLPRNPRARRTAAAADDVRDARSAEPPLKRAGPRSVHPRRIAPPCRTTARVVRCVEHAPAP